MDAGVLEQGDIRPPEASDLITMTWPLYTSFIYEENWPGWT